MVKYTMIVTLQLLNILSSCLGQWPLGQGFFTKMYQLQRNLNKMATNMETNMQSMQYNMAANMRTMQENMRTMQDRIARQRQYVRDNGQYSSHSPGFNTFTTSNGGTGYVYNSPDSSVNMFTYSSGPQHSGYVYHSGPDGTFYRRW